MSSVQGMDVVQAGDRVFSFADKHGRNVQNMLSRANFGESPADAVMLGHEVKMMGAMWQLASGLVKEMTEPLKSIVNK